MSDTAAPHADPARPVAKKPWYKKWWIWLIIAIVVIFIFGASQGSKDDTSQSTAVGEVLVGEESGQTAEELAEQQSREAAEEAAKAEAEAAKKAEEEAAAQAEEAARLDPATYSAISDRDWQLIEKDPDSHAGEKYVIYGYVTQADASTGTEAFRADTSGEWKEAWYDYDVNTIVIADPEIVKTVVTDDLVTMCVQIVGALDYDTQIGGSTTAVSVIANIVEVTGSSS